MTSAIAALTKLERAAILKDRRALLSDLLEITARDALALRRAKRVRFREGYWIRQGGPRERPAVGFAAAAFFRTLDQRSGWPALAGHDVARNMQRIAEASRGVFPAGAGAAAELVRARFDRRLGRAPLGVYLRAAEELRKAGL